MATLFLIIAVYWLMQRPDKRPAGDSHGRLTVTASVYPVYFFSREIGGDRAQVKNITPAGVEAHDYEPTAQDLIRIENSDLVVLNGAGLESWGDNLAANLDSRQSMVVASAGLADWQIGEEGQERADPHVWLSPVLAVKMVDNIRDGFIRADKANQDYYEKRAAALKTRLADLDVRYRQGLAHCRLSNIVTSHAAFHYLAQAYNLQPLAITGLSPDVEPSPAQLAELVNSIKDKQIKHIFFERLASPALSAMIAQEAGAATLVLDPLEGLVDADIARGRDYFTVMQDNLDNLRIALQCQ